MSAANSNKTEGSNKTERLCNATGSRIIVSVCMVTYNHAAFIAQAIEGVLMQKTSFKIELIIHDDASTDGSQEIIAQYEKQYPDVIRPIYQTENQYSKFRSTITGRFVLPVARGKYLAFCDGDDYWTDPYKLSRQVEFLEANPNYAVCFHNYLVEEGGKYRLHAQPKAPDMDILGYVNDLASMQTLSVVCRNVLSSLKLDEEFLSMVMGSYFWFLVVSEHGRIRYLDEVMAVYRVHPSGVWSGASWENRRRIFLSNRRAMVEYFKRYSARRDVYRALCADYARYSFSYAARAIMGLDVKGALGCLRRIVENPPNGQYLVLIWRALSRRSRILWL